MNLWVVGLACLATSVLFNVAQGVSLRGAHQQLQDAHAQLQQAKAAAQECSEGTEQLHELAEAKAKEAETARREAQKLARIHRQRADLTLAAPARKPGDDCGSARLRLDNWWEQRR